MSDIFDIVTPTNIGMPVDEDRQKDWERCLAEVGDELKQGVVRHYQTERLRRLKVAEAAITIVLG